MTGVNSPIVSQGLALAYRRYSLDYVDEEADAQPQRTAAPDHGNVDAF